MAIETSTVAKPIPANRRRRWLQFSLRTFFVFVTLVAAACAWLHSRYERAQRQRAAVEALASSGMIRYDYDDESDSSNQGRPSGRFVAPLWLRQLVGADFFRDVVMVCTSQGDDQLHHLRAFANLRRLTLAGGPKVTDAGLENVKDLSGLQELRFGGTKITSAGLKYVSGLNELETLDLFATEVSDEGLDSLQGLSHLQRLDLSETAIGDAGLIKLERLRSLGSLDLTHSKVTDAGVARLKRALPNCHIDR
jgi:Leucine Rich Repeat (LRR) protein